MYCKEFQGTKLLNIQFLNAWKEDQAQIYVIYETY